MAKQRPQTKGRINGLTPQPFPPTRPTPKPIEQQPPVLALFRSGPLAVLRIHDMTYSDVVSSVVKHLPADVINLMLVTPTDTKMFDIEGRAIEHASTPVEAQADEPDVQEQFISDTVEQVPADIEQAQAAVDTASTPAARRKAMMDMRKAERAGSTSVCGRCRGAGHVPVAMPDGGSSTAACPLCKGSGAIQRYGMRGGR